MRDVVAVTVAHGQSEVTASEVSVAEGRRLFEDICQRELGLSAEVFLSRYDAGTIPEDWDARAVQRIEFMIPFVRFFARSPTLWAH